MNYEDIKILVVIPCYNEEITIKKVIQDFRRELPSAEILVVDNNSKDRTAEIARELETIVIHEKRQGKGFAIQNAFQNFKSDLMVMVDGDDTYEASDVHKLLSLVIDDQVDMAVGNRINKGNKKTLTSSHWLGNKLFTSVLNLLFRTNFKDIFSGYRVFNKTYAENAIILAKGFEIESELTIQAIENNLMIKETDVILRSRKNGSNSKLKAIRDGLAILYTILSLFRDCSPLKFFSILSVTFLFLGIILGWYSISDYLKTGLVLRLPSLLVASFFILASFVSFIAGLILSSVKRRHEELMVILARKK